MAYGEFWSQHALSQGEDGFYSATVVYWIEAGGSDEAIVHPDLPQRGHLYRNRDGNVFDPFLIARSRSTAEMSLAPKGGGNGLFKVTVNFGTPTGGDTEEPVLNGPVVDRWSFATATGPIDTGFDGGGQRTVPIANSAGQVFDPPFTGYLPTFHLSAHRVIAAPFVPSQFASKVASMNSDGFRGAVAKEAFFHGVTSSGPREDGTEEIVGRFEFRPLSQGGFTARILDRDREGFLLDGTGSRLGDGLPVNVLAFDPYPSIPFSLLGFGT